MLRLVRNIHWKQPPIILLDHGMSTEHWQFSQYIHEHKYKPLRFGVEISNFSPLALKRNTFWIGPETSEFFQTLAHKKKNILAQTTNILLNFDNLNFLIF